MKWAGAHRCSLRESISSARAGDTQLLAGRPRTVVMRDLQSRELKLGGAFL